MQPTLSATGTPINSWWFLKSTPFSLFLVFLLTSANPHVVLGACCKQLATVTSFLRPLPHFSFLPPPSAPFDLSWSFFPDCRLSNVRCFLSPKITKALTTCILSILLD
ncbi:hypothetical protein BDV27DRAFT_112290 [Aspergillus caelatus]|uniref:Secreted protein n=1 Tax=Aspergillus caelatus TaxID=61420 RepID=A0A5N7A629_9EURO|nr:uncharacterized protein BDV27DRAFT_112290 [Aspergillus caelatus]KAE8364646.1 hypothetical protein BDV27DRAFT_112290 [Aspergillus caelatus]